MLPKSKRLNLKKDFKWVVSGKKLDSKFVTIFIKPGENELPRIGVATSSKYFKKAIARNRARRLVFSAIEKIYPRLPSNLNIMLLPKTSILDVKSNDVQSSLEDALKL